MKQSIAYTLRLKAKAAIEANEQAGEKEAESIYPLLLQELEQAAMDGKYWMLLPEYSSYTQPFILKKLTDDGFIYYCNRDNSYTIEFGGATKF